jgi:hypothetical protein
MTIDDLVVALLVLLAAAYMGRRLWRRLRHVAAATGGTGCGACGGCDGAGSNRRGCAEAPLVRRD